MTYHQVALDLRRESVIASARFQSLSTMAIPISRWASGAGPKGCWTKALPSFLKTSSAAAGAGERRVRLAESQRRLSQALDHQREITALRSAMAEEEGRLRVERLRETFDAEQREITIQSLQNEAMVAELRLHNVRP